MDLTKGWIPLASVVGIGFFVFGMGVAYANIDQRIIRLESAVSELRETNKTVIELSTKVETLIGSIDKLEKKIDAINAAVR